MKTEELLTEIKKRNAKRVMLQLPEGLKMKAASIAAVLKEAGIECIVSMDPCYGACDLVDSAAAQNGCDLLVHVGHSKFYRSFATDVPVMYFPWTIDIDFTGIDFSSIREARIGLVTTVQHLGSLEKLKELLEKEGKEVIIGGQILGCVRPEIDADAMLFVGSGRFHPLGYKTVYALDIEKREIEKIDNNILEKRRFANIHNAKDAKTFAILVTTKKGQNELTGNAREIKKQLEDHGKTVFIVSMAEINDTNLLSVKADAFINTACPRIVDDHFSRPIVNAVDIDLVIS